MDNFRKFEFCNRFDMGVGWILRPYQYSITHVVPQESVFGNEAS